MTKSHLKVRVSEASHQKECQEVTYFSGVARHAEDSRSSPDEIEVKQLRRHQKEKKEAVRSSLFAMI